MKNFSALALLAIPAAAAAVESKPNVVIIIADDLSYYAIGCYGAQNNRTPNIDRLAKEGMLFTNAWNSASMSAPTRMSLYTGMYPMHHGGYLNHSAIHEGIKTMPVYMSELGYRVGLAGKWHIRPEASFPFESIPGIPKNCVHHKPAWNMDGVKEFVARSKEEPFCMVYASINPHAPWTAGDASNYNPSTLILPPNFGDTPTTRERYAHYLAEVDVLDWEVGQVVKILKNNGVYDNTLILFLSEQGTQFAGAKWTNWRPGVKAAMLARWSGHIEPGSATDAIVQYEDILPTIMAVAGGKTPDDIDGRDIMPVFTGKEKEFRRYAYHVHNNVPEGPAYPIRAIGDGRYRLIWNLTPDSQYVEKHIEVAPWFISWKESYDEHPRKMVARWYYRPEFEFYDTDADPFEFNNLAGSEAHAAKQAELYLALQAWMKEQNDPGASADRP